MKAGRRSINVCRAVALYAQGRSCSDIGVLLAQEEGRPVRYQPDSISRALRRELDASHIRRVDLLFDALIRVHGRRSRHEGL